MVQCGLNGLTNDNGLLVDGKEEHHVEMTVHGSIAYRRFFLQRGRLAWASPCSLSKPENGRDAEERTLDLGPI